MLVVGLERGHDAGATIFVDGKLAVICEAERVLGVKHAEGCAPAALALEAALREINAKPQDVDAIVIADSQRENFETHANVIACTHSEAALFQFGTVGNGAYINNMPTGGDIGVIGLRPNVPVYAVCHHLAHGIGGYFMSGFNEAAVLVADGYGICAGTTAYRFEGNRWSSYEDWKDCFLLGWRYALFGEFIREIDKEKTSHLDFPGKVMGLQAYGEPKYAQLFRNWLCGGFEDYAKVWSPEQYVFFPELGGFTRNSTHARDPQFLNSLASMQAAFSDILCDAAERLMQQSGKNKIVISGGCGLNVIANTAIAKRIGPDALFIPPNCSDAGLSLGAAVIGALRLDKDPFVNTPHELKRSAYLGTSFQYDMPWSDAEKEYPVIECDAADRGAKELAKNLMDGKIIGYIEGRGEIGPRALGHRSILANPTYPNIKDFLNQKIKYREWWRPFAPVCRSVDAYKYFDIVKPCPYMLYSVHVRQEWRERLPSITHIDGTARLQIIEKRSDHPVWWDMLTVLAEETGCGVVLNTSFNLGGRPIVNMMSQIIEMMDTSQMDGIWIEGRIMNRNDVVDFAVSNTGAERLRII